MSADPKFVYRLKNTLYKEDINILFNHVVKVISC
ncbi:hypothetical protein WP8S18C01_22370 [Aeromonas caviae]|jgi:hypothetical protein|nr:hypothetical protein ACGSH8M1_022810 [Aeromonas caviae]BBS16906.1 hypothetical protein WP5W18E02_19430 [Aeromonas caviae]BBT21639.1 hypothetical protein WP8S17E03_20640 [Aeromonas caviae]BBT53274.1 hypothetical protein WP8S18C01_22370 [Aeromonas caviae]